MSNDKKHKNAVLAVFGGVVIVLILAIVFIFTFYKNDFTDRIIGGVSKTKELSQEAELLGDNASVLDRAMDNSLYAPVPRIDENDYVLGDTKAPLHVIVYNDYSSELGGSLNLSLNAVREEFPDSMAVAFRHFPMAVNNGALTASLAVECAGEQKKFFEMHSMILENTADENVILNKDSIMEKAEEMKLDMDKFTACLDLQVHKDRVQRQVDRAKEAGMLGSPNIFINGFSYPGAIPLDDFTDSSGEERPGLRSLINLHLKMLNKDEETGELTE